MGCLRLTSELGHHSLTIVRYYKNAVRIVKNHSDVQTVDQWCNGIEHKHSSCYVSGDCVDRERLRGAGGRPVSILMERSVGGPGASERAADLDDDEAIEGDSVYIETGEPQSSVDFPGHDTGAGEHLWRAGAADS